MYLVNINVYYTLYKCVGFASDIILLYHHIIIIHLARAVEQVVGVSHYQKSSGVMVELCHYSGVLKTVQISADISSEHGDFNGNGEKKHY